MARLVLVRSFLVVLGLISLTGCETLFHRKPADSKKEEAKDEIATGDVHELKADGAKAFHKSNRLSGGLSDQAREIESHFNIH